MPLILHQLVQDYLPVRKRQNTKGWWQFDAVCCHHRGHKHDTRGRGNMLISGDGSMIYNCYNCGFKAIYKAGEIGHTFEGFLGYLGIPRDKVQEAKIEILSKILNGDIDAPEKVDWFKPDDFKEVELPPGARPISEWLECTDLTTEFMDCVTYLSSRGRAIFENWKYYWSPLVTRSHDYRRKIIIPFMHKGKVIGWTERYAGTPPRGVPKYYNSDIPAGYLFNGDLISDRKRKYVLILEGPLDAIAVDAVGALGSTLNRQQIAWLNSTDAEKIVVPDRQQKNQDLIDTALEQGWSVSFPDWEKGIKDASDATLRYGRLYTLASIIRSRTSYDLEIAAKRKLLGG